MSSDAWLPRIDDAARAVREICGGPPEIGIVLGSAMLAYLFAEAERPAAFRALVGGGLLHMALDVLQRHLGVGYLLFYPFSTWDWEAAVIGSEDTVRALPVVLPLTTAASWWRWGRAQA